jgi:molybdopterin-guanine dinucleotide biosynthesis protein A
MTDVEGYVLIGGRSSRFGRDKAAALLGGVSLAERAVATMQEAVSGSRVTLVAADLRRSQPHLNGRRVITDTHPDRGPLGALNAAAADAGTSWMAVLACDLPFVTAEMMQRLVGLCSDEVDAVVPVQPDGRLQPLAAVYRAEVLGKRLRRILDGEGTPALMSVLDQIRLRQVPFDAMADQAGSEHFSLNINTPSDLEKAETIVTSLSSK